MTWRAAAGFSCGVAVVCGWLAPAPAPARTMISCQRFIDHRHGRFSAHPVFEFEDSDDQEYRETVELLWPHFEVRLRTPGVDEGPWTATNEYIGKLTLEEVP